MTQPQAPNNDSRGPAPRERTVLFGSVLLAVGAGLLVAAIWAAVGVLWRGTGNEVPPPENYPHAPEPAFAQVRAPVLGAVLVVAVLVLAALVVNALPGRPRRTLLAGRAVLVFAAAGLVVLVVQLARTGLRGGPGHPYGSGLPGTIAAWNLAAAGLVLLAIGGLAADLLLAGRPRRLALPIAALVAVVASAVVGLPQTYADAARVAAVDVRPVSEPIPARVGTSPAPLPGIGSAPVAVGPGYYADGVMYNADTGAPRWRLDVADRMYTAVRAQVFADAGIVVVSLTRPDGIVEERGLDADTGQARWQREAASRESGVEVRADQPRHHLFRSSAGVLTASSPLTGEQLWQYRTTCRFPQVSDGPLQIVLRLSCDDGSGVLTLDARTGRTVRAFDPGSGYLAGWTRWLGEIADRYEVAPGPDGSGARDTELLIADRATGATVLRLAPGEMIACDRTAACLRSAGDQTVLTSLTGAFGDVVFDRPWLAAPEDPYAGARPVILADQVIWADSEGVVVGDRATGAVTPIDGRGTDSPPQAVPGGVIIETGTGPAILRGES